MRHTSCVLILGATLALVAAGEPVALAQALSVEEYCELSVERLQLAAKTWERARRAPNTIEEAVLWQRYGTTSEAYYTFGSARRADVEAHLTAHPALAEEIDRLSERVGAAIAGQE